MEILIYGRGGQGGTTAAKVLATAILYEGKFVQYAPEFGPERRGAPVKASIRVDDKVIFLRTVVEKPDVALFLEKNIISQLRERGNLTLPKKDGWIIINAKDLSEEFSYPDYKIATCDVSSIIKELGLKVVNIPILGALAKITLVASLENLEKAIINSKIPNPDVNFQALKLVWERVKIGSDEK